MVPLLVALNVALAAPAEQAPSGPEGVYSLPREEFVAQARRDLATLKLYSNGLRRLQRSLEANAGLFRQKATHPYTPDQKRVLLTTWGAFFSYFLSAEGLRQRYWDFVKVPLTDGVRHGWGFVITHAALTTELAHGMTFSDRAAGNPQLEVLLDEPNAEFGVPARAFAQFKAKSIHVSTATQLFTGDAYGKQLMGQLERHGLLDEPDVRWALVEMRLNSKAARDRLLKRGPHLFAKNAVDIVKDATMGAIFPVQKNVAALMGDTRVRRKGQPLIQRAQALELLSRMEPGDIVVARQNWFLSNIGLPGFWPHAELHVGTAEQLAAYFDSDPEVRAWVAGLRPKADTFTGHLRAKFPEKWRRYEGGKDLLDDAPIRVIESISEGVSFTGVEHSMVVDYLGVMRPRLSRLEKAKAIARAFAYQGRPYDFDFDFRSDASLVCTELVWKSYAPSADMKGLTVPLVNVAGRLTLPANELVRLFDEELERPDRQLDFVGFLDGREKERRAVAGDVSAFRKTHQRVKWDLAQK